MSVDRRPMIDDQDYDFEVQGEVIKMIHDELPAVRWTCGGCGEDASTIFYQPRDNAKRVECEFCEKISLLRYQ